jgi:nitrogenase iron protein
VSDNMRGIAFYGKGGIGKSTTLSNVIAALSTKNRGILQIGCDPKHDSTRLILGGFTQTTVLEQLNSVGSITLDTVMLTGYNGIKCIECGGPEPGVGCAGRGIIQTFQLLKTEGLDTAQFDYVFFDVLGDVVCGGFAMPIRQGYADEVYIVTSGEIASLYAANNIARGITHFASSGGKLGGVIGNERGTRNEREVIASFARLIGSELVAFIPRSDLIVEAELASKTIMEYAPGSELAAVYQSIAEHIERKNAPCVPTPLTDKELDDFLRASCYSKSTQDAAPNSLISSDIGAKKQAVCPLSSNTKFAVTQRQHDTVYGCSLAGSYNVASNITDAVVVMHAPQGCSYISSSTHMGRDSLSIGQLPVPNLLCTNIRETDTIFGGAKKLQETLLQIRSRFPDKAIFVITSCTAGIIGEDINSVIEQLPQKGSNIFHILSDGVMSGDFDAGMLRAYQFIAEKFIDPTVSALDDMVNIIGEQNLNTTVEDNYIGLVSLFQGLDIKVNCRFVRNARLGDIRQFKKANVNILAVDNKDVQSLANFLASRFNVETLQAPLPMGFTATETFVRMLASRFDKTALAEQLIGNAKLTYAKRLAPLKKWFAGKRVLIFSSPHNIDWLIATLSNLDLEVLFCLPGDSSKGFLSSEPAGNVQILFNRPFEKYSQTILETHPDFVLTDKTNSIVQGIPCDIFPYCPLYGFFGGVNYAERLCSKLRVPFEEGWRKDERFF